MNLAFHREEEVKGLVQSLNPRGVPVGGWPPSTAIGLESNGQLLGGVLYSAYTGLSLQMHIGVLPEGRGRWATRGNLAVLFAYPFLQLECESVLAVVPQEAVEAYKMNLRLGFRPIALLSRVYPGGDSMMLQMNREECRWIGGS